MTDSLLSFLSAYGGPSLLLLSLVSATIVPLSSEAALVGALAFGMGPAEALVWVSIGNCMGVLLNYGIGLTFSDMARRRLTRSRFGIRALELADRHSLRCLLLSWMPFVGDPLTYAAGVFRIRLLHFVLLTFSLRTARYAFFVIFFL